MIFNEFILNFNDFQWFVAISFQNSTVFDDLYGFAIDIIEIVRFLLKFLVCMFIWCMHVMHVCMYVCVCVCVCVLGVCRLEVWIWMLQLESWRLMLGICRLEAGIWRLQSEGWRLMVGICRLEAWIWMLQSEGWRLMLWMFIHYAYWCAGLMAQILWKIMNLKIQVPNW